MEFSGELFPVQWQWFFAAGYVWLLYLAVRWAPWKRLGYPDQLNVFLGSIVGLLLLWTMRAEIQPGFVWHLSGMVTLTLMFGWSLAFLAGSAALLGIMLFGLSEWSGFLPTAIVFVALPVSLAQAILILARAYLPKHYFIYVFINAFFAAGLIAVLLAFSATALLLLAGAFSYAKLSDTYLLFLPLMFFPEAVLNGWLISIMVGFKPHWVGSFRDEEYLHGK